MKKRLLSLFLVTMVFVYSCLSAFATDTGIDIIDNPLQYYFENQLLGVQKGTGVTLICPNGDYSTLYTGGTLVSCPYDGEALVLAGAGGVQAKKYETGGGSGDGSSGVGRRPSGYVDDTGTASISQSGAIALAAKYYFSSAWNTDIVDSFDIQESTDFWHFNNNSRKISVERYSSSETKVSVYCGYILDTNNVPGVYYVPEGTNFVYQNSSSSAYLDKGEYPTWTSNRQTSVSSKGTYRYLKLDRSNASSSHYLTMTLSDNFRVGSWTYLNLKSTSDFSIDYPNDLIVYCRPTTATINKQTNITINQNVWNGNIYQDNSTNLTYIYPQYTTINENNETVTNISNNPIIYNSETKQYYTYDTVTNNCYYITYEAPSPSPDPDPTPTPEPGGDTGDTSGIMKILQEIKAVLVSGFAGITEKLQNIGVGGSTPETAKPGSSSGDKGQSWWEKLLSKIGDAIVDGLLGAISAVLKLIFKLFTTILGWIIWLVSQVLTLFPFLPPGLGALLIGGVVVCFIIGLIKFIRG